MDGGKGTGARAGLVHTCLAGGLAEDTALRNKENVAVGELLLELTDETGLDLVVSLQQGDRDEDDDGLLSVTNINLCKTSQKSLGQ